MECEKLSGVRSILLTLAWLLGAAVSIGCFFWFRSFFPPPSNDKFIASFFILAAFLAVSFFGIGHFICTRVFRVSGSAMEIPAGVGFLALFLTFYLRLSLNPLLPLTMLTLGCLNAIRVAFVSRRTVATELSKITTAIFITSCLVVLITLSFPVSWDGFLLFPNDFDSNLIHVTAPRIIVERGVYETPNWLRGLWLPKLTMALYTFILTFSNQLFLKTLNVVCFIQLAIVFARSASTATGRIASLSCFALLTALPEFRHYIVQTNLDTIFALFTVSAFFLLLSYLKNPTRPLLLLLAFICGLSAGQKHFGLMYSVPVMFIASAVYMSTVRNVGAAVQKAAAVALSGIIFTATFCCFYLHNLLSGNALLFPFFGSKINTYGWDEADLTQMIESTIPHWGFSKTLGGYFLLPFHLIQHPEKYQFYLTQTWADFGMSVAIGAVYVMTAATLLLRPIRLATIAFPCFVLCVDVALWYRGSQVIRYLFPVLICSNLLGAFLLGLCIERLNSSAIFRRGMTCLAFSAATLLSTIWIIPPKAPLAQNHEEILNWVSTYRGSRVEALKWLTQHAAPSDEILNLAGHTEIGQFPELTLCGDWFGRCRYSRFISGHIRFLPWPELREALKANKISYIIVNWDSFAPESKRPVTPEEWVIAIPKSTRECVEHLYNDGASTDVYKVKEACLR